jgi:cobalt-zinc-cadmium resistance protein CzcA
VVGAMLCTLFLTRYMMPILYSYFPAPRGSGGGAHDHLVEGTNYSRFFMHCFPHEEGSHDHLRASDNHN